jgi:hypothetical protein
MAQKKRTSLRDLISALFLLLFKTLDYTIMLHVTLPVEVFTMTTPVSLRVQKHRNFLRKSGLRPIQIWVPDTRNPNFANECLRQSKLAAQTDSEDTKLSKLLDEALLEIDEWTA